jgi:23S rRNA pseudouridine2604 synthase
VALVTPENRWRRDPSLIEFNPSHREKLAPAGRLDIDSTGLLVLTQNGTVARQLIDGTGRVEKEYIVRFGGVLTPHGLRQLNHGIHLDGRELRAATVTEAGPDTLRFLLREGRKRQIRRMCEVVGLRVVALRRVRIGKVVLGDLPYGQWRYLREGEEF